MKKGLLLLLNVFLIAVMIGGGYLLHRKWQDYQRQESITKTIQQMDQKEDKKGTEKHSGLVGTQYVTAYYPKTAGKTKNLIKEQMLQIIQELPQAKGHVAPTALRFYYAEVGDGPFKKSQQVTLKAKVYPVDKNVEKEKEEEFGSLLLNTGADEGILHLNHLFTEPYTAKLIFLEKIREELTKKQLDSTLLEEIMATLDETPLENWIYRYQQGQFEIDLAKEGTVNVPFANFYDVIDTDALMGDELTAYQAYQEKKDRKLVALTFDDGPSPETTPQALEILAKYHAKATFYMLGKKVAGNEKLIKQVKAAGHEIGNHSWNHPQLTAIPLNQAVQEISDTQAALQAVIGEAPRTMRPPYGSINQAVQNAVNVSFMLWDVDTLDWKTHNTAAIMREVRKTQPGSVILMHDIHQTTIDALPSVLEYLKENGYTFVTVSELFQENLLPHQCYYSHYQP
ncbi:polysaccharide deacetylase family protein [Streptococcus himalayensis]|uniref:Peptidoglycan-N-acetylglucosamine deacetylase n=1 Tax=Streptococcus himalayensis TaxID=1888195 RepID=A0A917A743_9STRE|nr:polysaccharide deacetylase family protein [Streptococcus himalayensis]GGE29528.1 peptidoglycan-N-acetylglucosamine deacetylase [Streptococcus himalayensis]